MVFIVVVSFGFLLPHPKHHGTITILFIADIAGLGGGVTGNLFGLMPLVDTPPRVSF
jgi:hypothetical protein